MWRGLHSLSGKHFAMFDHLHSKKSLYDNYQNFLYFSIHCLSPCQCTALRSLWLCLFPPSPTSGFYTLWWDLPEPSVLQAEELAVIKPEHWTLKPPHMDELRPSAITTFSTFWLGLEISASRQMKRKTQFQDRCVLKKKGIYPQPNPHYKIFTFVGKFLPPPNKTRIFSLAYVSLKLKYIKWEAGAFCRRMWKWNFIVLCVSPCL